VHRKCASKVVHDLGKKSKYTSSGSFPRYILFYSFLIPKNSERSHKSISNMVSCGSLSLRHSPCGDVSSDEDSDDGLHHYCEICLQCCFLPVELCLLLRDKMPRRTTHTKVKKAHTVLPVPERKNGRISNDNARLVEKDVRRAERVLISMMPNSITKRSKGQSQTMHPQDRCNLFTLPAELRNIIYEMVIGGHTLHIGKIPNGEHAVFSYLQCSTRTNTSVTSWIVHPEGSWYLENVNRYHLNQGGLPLAVPQYSGPQAHLLPLLHVCKRM
jgi:hypothetical protein